MRDREHRARRGTRTALLALAYAAFACAASAGAGHRPAAAQNTLTGAFVGTISDLRTDTRIGGALVVITSLTDDQTRRSITGPDGRFYEGQLTSGRYLIRVSAPGYKPSEQRRRLKVMVQNQVVPIPVLLEPDDAAQSARDPTAAAPPPRPPTPVAAAAADEDDGRDVVADINRADASRGGSFTEREVAALPLGSATFARTFDELALLLPGVAPPPQTLGGGSGPGVGPGVGSAGQFAVNGLRSRANNFTVDGSDNNDEDIGVRRQGFLALVPQSVESIQEYHVIALLAPAQYGRNLGAQVNAVSKSGGSRTHGTLYGLFNSSQLNARNFFDSDGGGGATPLRAGGREVRRNGRPVTVSNPAGGEDSLTFANFGLTLGGPLAPPDGSSPGAKSAFYFVSAEGALLNATRETSFAVPAVEQRGLFGSGARGLDRDPFSGAAVNAFPTTVGGDAVFSLFPFPNDPGGIYGANTLTQVLPAGGQSKIFSAKVDYNYGSAGRAQSLAARYNFTDDYRDIPSVGGAVFATVRPRVRTQNLSTFLNSELSEGGADAPAYAQLRASYGRTRLVFDEVRDASFLIPSRLGSALGPDGGRFLLNAPLFANDTLPGSTNVLYDSFFGLGVEDALGPLGQVQIAGFSPVGVEVFDFPQRRVNNTYQLAADTTWGVGRHDFAAGADLRRTEFASDLPRNARPLITFNGAPRLAAGPSGGVVLGGFVSPVDLAAASAPSGFFQAVTPGQPSAVALGFYQLNYYFQDSWRVRNNLVLSLGLRYEYNTPPRDASGRIERSFVDPALELVPGLRALLGGRTRIFDPDRDNFAPRLAAAYARPLFGPRRATVLRGGFGVFYDQALGAVVSQSRNVYPDFLTLNFAGGVRNAGGVGFNISDPSLPFFPCTEGGVQSFLPVTRGGTLNTLNPSLPLRCLVEINSAFPGGFGFTLPERGLEMPSALHYSFTFEQQLAGSLVASAAYVGTRGRSLLRLTTPNLGPNAFLVPASVDVVLSQPNVSGVALGPGQSVAPDGSVVGSRPVAGAGAVFVYESSGRSRYDSAQFQVRGRLGESLQFQAAYTLSRATDDASDIFELAGAPALPQNSLTFAGERAPANFDSRHGLTYNFVYEFGGGGGRGLRRRLLGGLLLAGQGRYHTGQPFTVNSIFDVNLDGNLTDRPDSDSGIVETGDRARPLRLSGDPLALLAPPGRDGRVPRNSFRAGGQLELDLAVAKSFGVYRGQRLTLRAEVFNLTNRANFGVPVRFLEAPGFGRAAETLTPGRRVQLALKYLF